jgi:hypothetical protein
LEKKKKKRQYDIPKLKGTKHQSIIPSMNLAIKREGKRSEPNKESYD